MRELFGQQNQPLKDHAEGSTPVIERTARIAVK
jgi:hypothetical protein